MEKKKRGRPSKADILKKQQNDEKNLMAKIVVVIGVMLFVGIFAQNLWSDTITFKFKSPSFSGINTSSHYLTIENQEFNRRQTIKDEIKAAIEEAERDKENSTVQRFIRNF